MGRQETLDDIQATFGSVPGFIQQMSDLTLEQWWATAKGFWMTDAALSMKTKSLVGLAAAAAQRCRY